MISRPETWNDKRLNEFARAVYVKALRACEKIMDDPNQAFNPDRLIALATVAESASSGFAQDNDDGDDD
jgi:hypothetical protein